MHTPACVHLHTLTHIPFLTFSLSVSLSTLTHTLTQTFNLPVGTTVGEGDPKWQAAFADRSCPRQIMVCFILCNPVHSSVLHVFQPSTFWCASCFPTQYILVCFFLSSPVHSGVLHAFQHRTLWCDSCFPAQYIVACFMLTSPVHCGVLHAFQPSTFWCASSSCFPTQCNPPCLSVAGCGSPVWTPTLSPAPGSWSSLWTPPWSLCPVVISSTPFTHRTWPARPTTTSSPPPRQRPTLVWRLGESADLFYLFQKVSLYNTSSFFISFILFKKYFWSKYCWIGSEYSWKSWIFSFSFVLCFGFLCFVCDIN